MFHYVNLIYSEHPNSELQWSAEIQTRSDFGQITFVWEQFMFKCNSVQNPHDFVRLSEKNLCPKAALFMFECSVFGHFH